MKAREWESEPQESRAVFITNRMHQLGENMLLFFWLESRASKQKEQTSLHSHEGYVTPEPLSMSWQTPPEGPLQTTALPRTSKWAGGEAHDPASLSGRVICPFLPLSSSPLPTDSEAATTNITMTYLRILGFAVSCAFQAIRSWLHDCF